MEFEVIYKVCIAVSCLFEIYLVKDFFGAFHECRSPFLNPYIRFAAFVFLIFVNISINFQNNSLLNLVFVPGLYFFMIIVLYRGEIKSYLLHWIVATFIMFSSEFIFLILQSIPMNVPTDQLFADPFVLMSSIFAVKLLSFILMLTVKQISRYSQEHFSTNIFANYIIVPVATLGVMWAIPYVRGINDVITVSDVILVAFYVLMLIGNIRLFYMFAQYNSLKKTELETEVALTRYRERESFFNEKKQIEQKQKVLIHDIKHYMGHIGRCAAKGEDNEIIRILKDLQVEFLENEKMVICSHSLMNSILLDWQERIHKQGIMTDIFVEAGFNIDFMRAIDIIAMFGNLLDNASEAGCQCEGGKIEAQFFMQNAGAFSVIHIKNDYRGEIRQRKGELLTTKKEEGYHGIGLKNTREIVESYRGYMQNSYSDHVYETTIMIPVNK